MKIMVTMSTRRTGEDDDDVFYSGDEEYTTMIINCDVLSRDSCIVTRQDHMNTSRYSSRFISCPLFSGGIYNCFDVFCSME